MKSLLFATLLENGNDLFRFKYKLKTRFSFPGCSCPHGQIYFNAKCQDSVPGCLFTHNNEQIFIKRGHRYVSHNYLNYAVKTNALSITTVILSFIAKTMASI